MLVLIVFLLRGVEALLDIMVDLACFVKIVFPTSKLHPLCLATDKICARQPGQRLPALHLLL